MDLVDRLAREYIASEAKFWRGLYARQKGLFYRGARKPGMGGGSGMGALGKGLYLTWNPRMAEFFARRSGGQVYTYKVKSNVKLLDNQSDEFNTILAGMGFGPGQYAEDAMFAAIVTREVKELGYDGVLSDNPAMGLVLYDERDAELVEG